MDHRENKEITQIRQKEEESQIKKDENKEKEELQIKKDEHKEKEESQLKKDQNKDKEESAKKEGNEENNANKEAEIMDRAQIHQKSDGNQKHEENKQPEDRKEDNEAKEHEDNQSQKDKEGGKEGSQEEKGITVKNLIGKTFSVPLKDSMSLLQLKEAISTIQQMQDPAEQRLIFQGKVLSPDTQELSQFGIKEGSVIHQVLRLKACEGVWCCESPSLPTGKFLDILNDPNSSQGNSRVRKEMKSLRELHYCSLVKELGSDFIFKIKGPEDSQIYNGNIIVHVQLPTDYPFKPFKIRIVTPVFHPLINGKGIMADIVNPKLWAPYTTMERYFEKMQKSLVSEDLFEYENLTKKDTPARCFQKDFHCSQYIASNFTQYYGNEKWTPEVFPVTPKPLRLIIITFLLCCKKISPPLPSLVTSHIIKFVAESATYTHYFDAESDWWEHLQGP